MTPNLSQEMTNPEGVCSPEIGRLRETTSRQNANGTIMTRVDAPHEAAQGARGSADDEPAPAAQFVHDESLSEQINLQATQLAAHLRSRQEELDHREAELNSRVARLESDARAGRLWIDEHEGDLAFRGDELARRELDLAARSEAIGKSETELARRFQELSDREGRLLEREREVERRLARLAAVEAAQQRRASDSDPAKVEESRCAAEALESRRRQLDEAERRLAESQAEVQGLYEHLAAERLDFADRCAAIREQMAVEQRQTTADLEEKRRSVQRRAEHVDQRWAVLQQLRAELGRIHRETLEIRLATEELWAQLSGDAPPATLTQSLGRIRTKLAEQYSLANVEMAEQRKALEAIRGQLIAEHEKLVEQKRQFERWTAACREDCRQQASRLVAREQELHNERIGLRQQLQRWQAERLRYQLELRRLQSQTGVGDESPILAP